MSLQKVPLKPEPRHTVNNSLKFTDTPCNVTWRVLGLVKVSVSQTVVRGPQVVLGFCPCCPFRLNICPKKTEKNKINVNCVSHTIVEHLKQSLEITYNKRL